LLRPHPAGRAAPNSQRAASGSCAGWSTTNNVVAASVPSAAATPLNDRPVPSRLARLRRGRAADEAQKSGRSLPLDLH